MQKFEPFQKVLVRQTHDCHWKANIYANYSVGTVGHHQCIGGACWMQCIPYEGNEHLLGTTNEPEPKHEYQWGDKVKVFVDGLWVKGLYLTHCIHMANKHSVYIHGGAKNFEYKDIRPVKQ